MKNINKDYKRLQIAIYHKNMIKVLLTDLNHSSKSIHRHCIRQSRYQYGHMVFRVNFCKQPFVKIRDYQKYCSY